MIRKLSLASLALACVALTILFPIVAIAAEVATASDTAVVLPYGDWIVAGAEMAKEILIPVLIAAATALIARAPWWLKMFLTTQRVDRMIRLAADYAINAVADVSHDKAVSVNVGSTLLKTGLERALGSTPKWIIDAAGGPKGITERLFRAFKFDETVSDANTLSPVIRELPSLPFLDPLQAPPAPMNDR